MASRFAGELKLDRAGRIALAKQAVDLAEEVRRVDANNPLIYATFAGHALISGDIEGASSQAARRTRI